MGYSKCLRPALPLGFLLAMNLLIGPFTVTGRPSASTTLLERFGTRRRNGTNAGQPARTRSGTGAPATAAITPDNVIDSGVVTTSSAAPSNGDLLLQYLNKRASSNGKTAQQLIEKLVSKKGGVAPATSPPAQPAARMAEPQGDLVEVVDTENCIDVPISVPYDCVQKELKQTAYPCSLNFYPEVCSIVTRTMETKCPATVERTIPYQCPQLKNKQICYNQPSTTPSTCFGLANKATENECERSRLQKACSIVDSDISWTCLETKDMDLSYTCSALETMTECAPDLVAVDDNCTRETKVPMVYDYYDVEPQRVCEMVKKKSLCTSTFRSVTLQTCPETYYEKECQWIDVPVTKPCDVPAYVTEEYSCEKTEMQTFKKPCGYGLGKKFLRVDTDSTVNINGNGNGTKMCDYEAPITVIGMCTREVVVNKAQTCTEMEKKEECQMVEKIREVACEAPSVRSIDSECDNGEEEEVCVDVNKTVTKKGIRYETKLETFPCTSTYAKEVCVEVVNLVDSTCSATLSETSEVPCTRKHKKQVCQDKDVPSVEVCTDISEQEIQYACDQLTFEEKCITVPQYELEECAATIVETILQPCETTFQVTECIPQDVPQMGTCFRDEEVEVAGTCFKVESERNCSNVVTTRVLRDALDRTAKTPR